MYQASLIIFLFTISSLSRLALVIEAWPLSTIINRSAPLDRRQVFDVVRIMCTSSGLIFAKPPSAHASSIELLWDDVPTGSFPVAINGVNNNIVSSRAPAVIISYDNHNLRNIRTTIYQKTGSATTATLDKAAALEWNVARALDIGDRLGPALAVIRQAVLSSPGRRMTIYEDVAQPYYEFDLSTPDGAPILVSATVLNRRLYVMVMVVDADGNGSVDMVDLSRVRSSFRVRCVKTVEG